MGPTRRLHLVHPGRIGPLHEYDVLLSDEYGGKCTIVRFRVAQVDFGGWEHPIWADVAGEPKRAEEI